MQQAVGTAFAAVAFAGAGKLFGLIDSGGHSKEMKRHNLAMEKMQRDKNIWYEAREEELDRLSKLHYDHREGGKDLDKSEKAFYNIKTKFDDPEYKEVVRKVNKKFSKTEPKLRDYYKPSPEMSRYVAITEVLLITPVVFALSSIVI